jgi:hypothetical protein
MTRARRELVDLESTPYYHSICRCVRRAFLCGEDAFSGKSYEHRNGLGAGSSPHSPGGVRRRRVRLSRHVEPLVRLDRDKASGWTEDEIIERWERLYSVFRAAPYSPPAPVGSRTLPPPCRTGRAVSERVTHLFFRRFLPRKYIATFSVLGI